MRTVLLNHFGTDSEPVGRQELWLALLAVSVVVISFLVFTVADRGPTWGADSTPPWAQRA